MRGGLATRTAGPQARDSPRRGWRLARVSFRKSRSLTTCPTRLSHRLKTCESFPAFSRWTNGCATVTVGRSCSAKVNEDEDSALISLTSGFALTLENGIFPIPLYEGFMHARSSIRTYADGSRSNRG